jgi:GAF domain-containing protein
VRLLTTLANALSVALENARLFDEAQRRTRETAVLAEVGRDISSTLDLAKVLDRIARHAMELLHGDNSAIFLPQPDGKSYRAIVAIGTVARRSLRWMSRPAAASSAACLRPAARNSSTTRDRIRAASRSPARRRRQTSA